MSLPMRALATCLMLAGGIPAAAQDPDVVQVGIADSIVKELSPGRQKLLVSEFSTLAQEFTGRKSQVGLGGDPFVAAKKLASAEWHLVVLQGVEFARMQAKDPKLQPLMLAIQRKGEIHAAVVVKKGGNIAKLEDLKEKVVWIQPGKEHCGLFAEKIAKGDVGGFFSKFQAGSSAENALDQVLRGMVQAAVVDSGSLHDYQDINPGKFSRLQVVAKSEPFPPMVIVHREGVLNETVLSKFKSGMLNAKNTQSGREAMANVQVTSFETVPPSYSKLLSDILKAYPNPTKTGN